MAITVADNFSYQGKKPLDGRDGFDTLAQMKAYPEASVYDGCMTYCKEDEKYYTFKASNTVDVTTGKWREFSGGGGQTYNDFTGATASTAGTHGLVPAPSAGDEDKVLFGSGLWGALPSVDLSVLSNEANILSTTEKVVGQHTDGKLLYQKVVSVPSTSTAWGVIHTETNADYLNVIWARYYFNAYGTEWLKMNLANANDVLCLATTGANVLMNARGYTFGANNPVQMLIQYTKTTDSPLPSGVKFAGVTSSGAVIYKKEVDLGSDVEITPTGWYTSSISKSGMSLITSASSISSGGTYTPLMAAVDNGDYVRLKACRGDGNTTSARYITLCYTST